MVDKALILPKLDVIENITQLEDLFYKMDIKSERCFQGRGNGKYNVRLNTNGQYCFGPYDSRYKTNITKFLAL